MKDDKSTISKPVQFLYIKLVMSHRENLRGADRNSDFLEF